MVYKKGIYMKNESQISEFILENKPLFCEEQKGKIFLSYYSYEHYRYKPQVTDSSESEYESYYFDGFSERYPVHKKDYYDRDFVERMDVAEYILNQLGLIRLIHQFPPHQGNINDDPLVFTIVSAEFINALYHQQINGVCEAWQPYLSTASIVCRNDIRQFKFYGVGILIHEVFHLLDIPHLHEINREETNQILLYSAPTKESNSFVYRGINYTPLSLFSMMHYGLPYGGIRLNETRIQELLVNLNFSNDQITNYFSLLEYFGGSNMLLTYQDIQLLAHAVYTFSPTSLMGRKLQLPYYYFIDAVYSKFDQKKQMIDLINAFRISENFTYSLLAQNDIFLKLTARISFTINLRDELKIVSLNDQIIHCFLNDSNSFFNISDDCILQANIPHAAEFNITVSIDDTYNKIQRTLRLIVENPIKILLLGRPQPIYENRNTTVDLRYLCAAVSYPVHDELQCEIEDLPEDWSQNNCSVFRKNLQNKSISVTFFNSAVNKTCQIQFRPRDENIILSSLLENNTLSNSYLSVNQSINTSELISYWPGSDSLLNEHSSFNESINSSAVIAYAAYLQNPYTVNESQFTKSLLGQIDLSERISEQLINHLKHVFYITGIPILQGVFEAVIDETQLSVIKKSILKLIPRIGLISLGYFSSLQIPILLFYSLSECFISKHLIEKQRIGINHLLNGLLFLIVTELEYGFSNLWELSDKLEFWPELSARFNQLFLQFLFAPTLKSASYLTTLTFLNFIRSNNKQEQNQQDTDKVFIDDNSTTNLASNDCSFFNSLSNAASVVFSKKILRLPGLFIREISDNLTEKESQNSSRIYAFK